MDSKELYGHRYEWERNEEFLIIDGYRYELGRKIGQVIQSNTFPGSVFLEGPYGIGGEWIHNPSEAVNNFLGQVYVEGVNANSNKRIERPVWLKPREILVSGE